MNRSIKIFVTGILLILCLWWGRTALLPYFIPTTCTQPLIGIVQVIDHPALDQTRQGLIDGLKAAGFESSKNIQITHESAQGNPALAAQIVQKFVGQKAKILVALGTTPAQAAAQITQGNKDIPVIFASVTDPVGAKLLVDTKTPEANVTGVSNLVSVEAQFNVFRKIIPALKRLGVIYNPGEANSQSLVNNMQEIAKKQDISLVLSPASRTSEVLSAAQNLVGKVDAIFVNNDNTALAAFEAIAHVGQENNIPVFSSDLDVLDKGALAAVGPNQYDIGQQTARILVRILRDNTAVSSIPVEWPARIDTKINETVATRLGLPFALEFMPQAEREGVN